jgi:predicted acetyltransferase
MGVGFFWSEALGGDLLASAAVSAGPGGRRDDEREFGRKAAHRVCLMKLLRWLVEGLTVQVNVAAKKRRRENQVMPNVEIHLASRAAEATIDNLMQLYIHDFSEFWTGTDDGELQDDGRFGSYRFLPDYWVDEDRVPLLVLAAGKLAGFALLNGVTHSGAPADRNMAEFFIARKHRRAGVGLAAAHAIFGRYPGLWEVAVARRNTGALAFWRRVVGSYALAGSIEEIDVASAVWDGAILRFRAPPADNAR